MEYIILLAAIVGTFIVLMGLSSLQLRKLRSTHRRRLQPLLWITSARQLASRPLAPRPQVARPLANTRPLAKRPSNARSSHHQPADGRKRDRRALNPSISAPQSLEQKLASGRYHALQKQIEVLAARGWPKDEASWNSSFILHPTALDTASHPHQILEILIYHARQSTPGFEVSQCVLPSTLESVLVSHRLGAQALLSRALCQQILQNSGLNQQDVTLNERDTDICLFVCGFGRVFLKGYQKLPLQMQQRLGPRLGYLSDVEYIFVHQYIMQLRKTYQSQLLGRLQGRHQQHPNRLEPYRISSYFAKFTNAPFAGALILAL
ncbi:MAG: hypothetical protein HC800_00390 [Phormidesmis sp. RL_2_1]|nr:hypothetical protein [Phormidesmis sp. RL_2_1]